MTTVAFISTTLCIQTDLQCTHRSKYLSLLIFDKVSSEAVASMEGTDSKQFVDTNREKEVLVSFSCICITKVLLISILTFDIFQEIKIPRLVELLLEVFIVIYVVVHVLTFYIIHLLKKVQQPEVRQYKHMGWVQHRSC